MNNSFAVLRLLRPTQWLKNLMLFFPPFLGGVILQSGVWQKGILPFASFCLVSSSTYIFNDILDAEKDALHPRKKRRPIASGQVPKRNASVLSFILLLAGGLLAWMGGGRLVLFLALYLAITVSYTLWFKNYPLLDVFCIAVGFLLRLEAGGFVFGVDVSAWLFLSVFLLALFLSTGKRLSEKLTLCGDADCHRKSLAAYPDGFLDGMMVMTGSAVLMTYTMYVIHRSALVYTVPLCAFGLIRYLFLIKSKRQGDPMESLLKDGVLFAVGLLWALMTGWGVYG